MSSVAIDPVSMNQPPEVPRAVPWAVPGACLPPAQPLPVKPQVAEMPKRGRFVVFDGIDGCGKTGALSRLYERMLGRVSVVKTKHPGASMFGEALRNVMFKQFHTSEIDATALELLFAADHCHNRTHIVEPALRAGTWVLADRDHPVCNMIYRRTDPTRMELPRAFYETIWGRRHDLFFLLDGPPEILLQRAQARTTETHQAAKVWNTLEEATRMRERFLDLWADNPSTVIINALHTQTQIDMQIDGVLQRRYGIDLGV